MKVTYLKTTLNQKFPKFRQKMDHIGFGIHAHVYSDGSFAYKECQFDSNYVKWLLNLRQNKLLGNPHVPEVYEIFVDKKKEMCLVKMELLKAGNFEKTGRTGSTLQNKIYKITENEKRNSRKSTFDPVLQNLAEFIMKQERRGRRIALDLHGGNIMMRYKQMVITDPVV